MTAIAKIFSTGNSQAVRLPKAFRVTASEMWISRNEITGEITLKPRSTPAALERLFKLIEEAPLPDDFLAESARMNLPPTPPTFGSTSGPAERSTKPRKTAKPRA